MSKLTKQETAQILGLDPTQVGTVKLQLGVLKNRGILIALDIRGTSIFAAQADWADLGIAGDDPRAKRLTRGRKYLIPESVAAERRSLESRARQLLEKLTYDVTGFAPFRFLPFEAYPKFKEIWEKIVEQDNQFKADLIDRLDDYRDLAAADFAEIASAAWATLEATGNADYYPDRDSFTDSVIARAMQRFPSESDIESKLTMSYHVSLAFGVDELAKAESDAALVAARAAEELAAARSRIASEEERARHEAEIHRLEEAERNARYEAIRQAEAEHYKAQLEENIGPLKEMFLDLRNRMAEAALEMAESVEKSGFVRGKVAQRGRGLLEFFNLMSVADDGDMKAALEKLNAAIGQDADERGTGPARSTEEVKSALQKVITLAEEARAEITAAPTRFAGLRVMSELQQEEEVNAPL